MIQCCPLGGLQYINDDGTIDRAALQSQLADLVSMFYAHEWGNDWQAQALATQARRAAASPCTCPCHRKHNPAVH